MSLTCQTGNLLELQQEVKNASVASTRSCVYIGIDVSQIQRISLRDSNTAIDASCLIAGLWNPHKRRCKVIKHGPCKGK